MTTPQQRLELWATKLGTTPNNLKQHTANTANAQRCLNDAKQRGATNDELVALAVSYGDAARDEFNTDS